MSFSAEARAKLSLDTTAFERALTRTSASVGAAATGMNQKLKRAFGAGDAFKGLLMGLGVGSVSAIADAIQRPYEAAAQAAKDVMQHTGRALAATRAMFNIGKDAGQLAKEEARTQRDLFQDRERVQDRIAKKEAARHTLSGLLPGSEKLETQFDYYSGLNEDRVEIQKINADLQESAAKQKALLEEQKKVRAALVDKMEEEFELSELQLRDASKLETILKKQELLRGRMKRAKNPTERDQLGAEIMGLGYQAQSARKTATVQYNTAVVSVGQAAARGRTFSDGSPKPKSETERIASRGEKYAKMADDAVLTGRPNDAARYNKLANRDLGNAGERVKDASRMVEKDPSKNGVVSQLTSANTHLEKISANLAPTKAFQ